MCFGLCVLRYIVGTCVCMHSQKLLVGGVQQLETQCAYTTVGLQVCNCDCRLFLFALVQAY